jgi:hypothetical protein
MFVVATHTAFAQAEWKVEREPGRHALVLSAARYVNMPPLRAPDHDASDMERELTALRFKVTRAELASARAFETAISAFRVNVQEGDLVVVYFSGHGFLYEQGSYLAPADLKSSLKKSELIGAVTLGEIEGAFERVKPGFLLIIADACRTIANFVVASDDSSELKAVAVKANGTRGPVVNSIFAVASRDGTPARGATATDSISPFTAALLQYFATPGKEFRHMFLDVKKEVYRRTETQQPWLFDFAFSELYLNPDDSVRAQERREWNYVVEGGSVAEITEYQSTHPVNRHAYAAKKWLATPRDPNARGAAPGSLVSPQAIERAFEQELGRQAISRVHSGLLYDRWVDLSENASVMRYSARDLGLVPSGTPAGSPFLSKGKESLEVLFAHGSAITTKEFVLMSAPSNKAARVAEIPVGTRVQFKEAPLITESGTWFATTFANNNVPVYFRTTALDTAPPLELGHALLEISVGPVAVGIPDIVDEAPIRSALAQLRREGKTVTWVSLATGMTTTPDSAGMLKSRSRYAKYVVRDAGIKLQSISSVAQSPGVDPGTVRLRIFGY